VATITGIKISFKADLTPPNLAQNLQHMNVALDKALLKYMQHAKEAGVKAATTKIHPRNFTGALERSVRNDSRATKDEVVVGSNLSYAAFQDGAKQWGLSAAGWPNVQSLRSWVQRRIGGVTLTDISSATYLIGRSIKQRGRVKNPIHFMAAAERAVKTEAQTVSMRKFTEDIYRAVNR
jgi:hypothetical protein